MTESRKLTVEDARALLSDHVEGSLDAGTRAEVDALLAKDPGLSDEHRRLAQTLKLLSGLSRPEAPSDMVAKVRARLTEERQQERAPVVELASHRRARWGGIEAAIGLAAAASVAVFIAVAGSPTGGGPSGTHTAGVAGAEEVVTTTIVAPDVPRYVVTAAASKAGMDTVMGDTYEGDKRAAARFMIALKEVAATRGVEISGFVPDAERVRIEVRSKK